MDGKPPAIGSSVPHKGRWYALAAGMLAQAAVSTLQQGLPSLGPYLRTTFDLSLPALGVILACGGWGAMLMLYFWGRLSDSWGERATVSLGIGGAALALGAVAATQTLISLAILLVIAGAMSGSAISGTGRAIMGWFPRSERGLALGLRQMAVPVGAGISAAMLPFLAINHGLAEAFLALAAFFAITAVISFAALRPPPNVPEDDRPRKISASPVRDPALWRVSGASGVLQWTQVAMTGFLVVILTEQRGIAYETAAGQFAAVLVVSGLMRVALGWLSDRLGHRLPLLFVFAVALFAVIMCAGGLVAGEYEAATLALIAATVLALSWNGLAFAAVAELAGAARAGTALGLHGTLMRALTIPTALVFGWLAQGFGWAAALAVLSAFPLLSAVLLFPLAQDERRRYSNESG